MITEAQRRALFALREALHLCEGAGILALVDDFGFRLVDESITAFAHREEGFVDVEFVDALLAEHPEDEPEPLDHGFKVGQMLRCLHVPNRHEGYFTPGCTYEIDAVDTSDTFLPLLMNSDESMTLWCEASAFEATS